MKLEDFAEGNMQIRQLVYTSQANQPFTPEQTSDLLEGSRARNLSLGVTGMLLGAANGNFVQVIEGSIAAIEETFARIAHDMRHTSISVLLDQIVSARAFPDWSMGYRELPRSTSRPGEASTNAIGCLARADDLHARVPLAMMLGIHDSHARTDLTSLIGH